MKLNYLIVRNSLVEDLVYRDFLGLPPDTYIPPHVLILDTVSKEFYLACGIKDAMPVTLRDFISRVNFLSIPSLQAGHFISRGLFDREYFEIVCKTLESLGAIPKKNLIPGHTYYGDCRNSSTAIWLEEGVFEYQRNKFGITYPEKINHYEDDDDYDLFIPYYEKKEESNCKN